MRGAAGLALRHAAHHPVRSALVVLSVCIAVLVPVGTRVLLAGFEASLLARAAGTPLVAGAKGNRFDLVMSALYFRRAELAPVSVADWRMLEAAGAAGAVPLNARFTARGAPIVATTSDYYDARGLRAASGSLPARLGDAVLGARAAASLGVGAGDPLFSDQRELYDIAKPPALKMRVVGVLRASGTPDDDAVFTDLKTAWILEGLSHGHAAPAAVPESLILERGSSNVAISESLVDYNEVTDASAASFHVHAPETQLPLTGVLLFPRDAREATLIKARVNSAGAMQVANPGDVVAELLGYVVRLQRLIDGLSALLAILTALLLSLVTALSAKARSREIETLRRIGASRGFVVCMFAAEVLALLALGGLAALGVAGVAARAAPDLIKFL